MIMHIPMTLAGTQKNRITADPFVESMKSLQRHGLFTMKVEKTGDLYKLSINEDHEVPQDQPLLVVEDRTPLIEIPAQDPPDGEVSNKKFRSKYEDILSKEFIDWERSLVLSSL